MLTSQHDAWIHACATLAVVAAGAAVGFSRDQWCALILALMAVWTSEALNTAFEILADVSSPGFDPRVKLAKDVAAGAVLISALGSAGIGIVVFGPHLLRMVR